MVNYFTVRVEFEAFDERGKLKKQKYSYLVDAMSVTEAEVRITQFLLKSGANDFEVKAASKANIVAVVSHEDSKAIKM